MVSTFQRLLPPVVLAKCSSTKNTCKAGTGVGFKRLKKILKRCRGKHQIGKGVCDGTFFPTLLKEMSAIAFCFNSRAQKLLQLHLATGFEKYLILMKNRFQGKHVQLIEEGEDLVTYATVNAVAIRKILKKYDKIHHSKQGQAFRLQARSMSIEILHSPWLNELIAFYINLKETKSTDTVFDPVSLTCGHILCYMCACSAASVTTVDGIKAALPRAKCPLCRKEGVYRGALHLDELNILLSRSCPEYWMERLKSERIERIQQAKKHWETQCRTFVGV